MASIGTTLYIIKHDRLPDGRLLVINKGDTVLLVSMLDKSSFSFTGRSIPHE